MSVLVGLMFVWLVVLTWFVVRKPTQTSGIDVRFRSGDRVDRIPVEKLRPGREALRARMKARGIPIPHGDH